MRIEWFFIWINLNPLYLKMHCAMFCWNWPCEKDFKISSMYFCFFVIISLWKRVGPAFEQTGIPFAQGCIVLSIVENGPLVLEKKSFEFCQMYFRYFEIISLERGQGPLFKQNWVLNSQRCFVPSLVEIGSTVLKKVF